MLQNWEPWLGIQEATATSTRWQFQVTLVRSSEQLTGKIYGAEVTLFLSPCSIQLGAGLLHLAPFLVCFLLCNFRPGKLQGNWSSAMSTGRWKRSVRQCLGWVGSVVQNNLPACGSLWVRYKRIRAVLFLKLFSSRTFAYIIGDSNV